MRKVIAALICAFIAVPAEANEVECLAKNIYYEARNQNFLGMYAVAEVTLNRVNDRRWPNDICSVVEQRKIVQNQWICQFSWFCDGKSDDPEDSKTWLKCLTLARNILQGAYGDITEGATHYHSVYVNPYWADSLNETVTINEHIFYK